MSITIPMGEQFATKYESVLLGKRKQLSRVWPVPGAVVATFAFPDDELTPTQAKELGMALVKAADDAEHLTYIEEDDAMVDDRTT